MEDSRGLQNEFDVWELLSDESERLALEIAKEEVYLENLKRRHKRRSVHKNVAFFIALLFLLGVLAHMVFLA